MGGSVWDRTSATPSPMEEAAARRAVLDKIVEDTDKRLEDRAKRKINRAALKFFTTRTQDVRSALAATRNSGRAYNRDGLRAVAVDALGKLTEVSEGEAKDLREAAQQMADEFNTSGNLAAAGEIGRQAAVALAGASKFESADRGFDDGRPASEVVASIPRA